MRRSAAVRHRRTAAVLLVLPLSYANAQLPRTVHFGAPKHSASIALGLGGGSGIAISADIAGSFRSWAGQWRESYYVGIEQSLREDAFLVGAAWRSSSALGSVTAGIGRIDERHCTFDCDFFNSDRTYTSESRLGLALSADIGVFRFISIPNFFGVWAHANINQTRSVYAIGVSAGLGMLW